MTDHPLRLKASEVYRSCEADQFSFKDTSEITPKQTIFGQERGVTAIQFGIDIDVPTFNLFVLGPDGTGRLTAVKHFIDEQTDDGPTPGDWCYVYNFEQPHRPHALRLPAGQGAHLKQDMENLINTLQTELSTLFESETYIQGRSQILAKYEEQNEAVLRPIEKMARDKSFSLQPTPQGALMILPIKDGKPLTPDMFESLTPDQKSEISKHRAELTEALEDAFRQSRDIQNQAQQAVEQFSKEAAQQVVGAHLGEVLQNYDLSGDVITYFQNVRADIMNNLTMFNDEGEDEDDDEPVNPLMPPSPPHDKNKRYAVNLIVENKPDTGPPVVWLDLPTYQNLVGRIEHIVRFGVLSTDFTLIKPGALHQANGGFLIIRAMDILQHPFAWEALKRTLFRQEILIEDPDMRQATVNTTQQLQPEAIPLNLKVVLVGDARLYYALYENDDRFRELFQVKADFVNSMERNAENEDAYAQFIATMCHSENLLHFEPGAVNRVVDYGSWLISDQHKLSTRFGALSSLVYESVFHAKQAGQKVVRRIDVETAIEANTYRNDQLEELNQEQIYEGTMFIDTTGEEIGQINGLVVIDQGDHRFGLPSRVTARVCMGRKEVLQIDRESRMTGPIHDKGVLILQGYLGGRYAKDYPLTLSATLTFEQSYGGVEGDSASSTELYALLSALAEFPIRQDLAVTGSVNQLGKVQPIGGVTQKVEGFFKICQKRGLTGTQGAIIPKSNVRNLMLSPEVVQAIEDGQFHIYGIETIDEGIALLTGKTAEEVHEAVDERLLYLAETLAEFENHR